MRLLAVVALCVGAATSSGCVDHIEAPSAYDSVVDPCDDADALATRVDACRAGPPCAGVLGLSGTLEGDDVVVDAQLDSAVFDIVIDPTTAAQQIDSAVGNGNGTHFFFSLSIASIGGADDFTGELPEEFTLEDDASAAPFGLEDRLVDLDLRVTADGESKVYQAFDDSGHVLIDRRAPGELGGRFRGDFGSAQEPLTGCFLFLASERRVVGPN